MVGHMPIGEPGMIVAVPDVQLLMRRQMLLSHAHVVVHVSAFHVGVLRRVPGADANPGGRVLCHHDDHLAAATEWKWVSVLPDRRVSTRAVSALGARRGCPYGER